MQKKIFEKYFLHRQTLKQLSAKYDKSIPWIIKKRDEYIIECKIYNPRAINLICDATFYGKRKDKLGTLVFKNNESKEIFIWKHIKSEFVKYALKKTKGAFPNDNSLLKLLLMSIRNAQKKWTMPIRNWSLTTSQLSIHFEGLLDKALNL